MIVLSRWLKKMPAAGWLALLLMGSGSCLKGPSEAEQIGVPEPYEWQRSTAAAEGMDTVLVAAALADVKAHDFILGFLVVKNGKLVAEYYNSIYGKYTSFDLRSATKSIISPLVGIALRERFLDSTGQKVLPFFFQFDTSRMDPRVRDLTLEHLLTMTTGVDFDETADQSARYNAVTNWTKETLELPYRYQPGERFTYCSPMVSLLSTIVARATRLSTREFADWYLCEPLGITVRRWETDPQGNCLGGVGVHMTGRDLARFGYLFANGGAVGGRQVVPAEWIRTTLTPHVELDRTWGALTNVDYGYLWWTAEFSRVSVALAAGYAGQFLVVVPSHNLVVVLASYPYVGLEQGDVQFLAGLNVLTSYLFPSAW
jgi:CubicO group peptidase (beta-lactamase class C family)